MSRTQEDILRMQDDLMSNIPPGLQPLLREMVENEMMETREEKGPDGYYEHKLMEKVEWMIDDEHLTPEDVVRRAVEVKEKGNAFLRSGELQRAGISYLVSKQLDRTQPAAPNNCAEVMLRLHKYPFAEVQATDALAVEPGNGKALLRRAKARKMQGKFALAAEDLDALPPDAAVDAVVQHERGEVARLIALNMSPARLEAWKARMPREIEFPGKVELETASDLGLMIAGGYAKKKGEWKGM